MAKRHIALIFLAAGLALAAPRASAQDTVFPKVITPNGDGINDTAFFSVENPTDMQIHGSIYDLRSDKVADLVDSGIISGTGTTLMKWDGRDDSGAVVPGGVYLYKIEAGDRRLTGLVGVAR